MKAKLTLFVTTFLIFNVVAIGQNKKQKVKYASQTNNASSLQRNNAKAARGNTNFLDSMLLIKSPKTKNKQGGQ